LSMGGMIAIDWMNRYPDEVTSAVLINTSLGNISPFYRRLRWQNYYKIIQLLFTAKQQREQLILAMTSNTQSDSSELLADWQQWQKESPVSSASAKNQLLASAIFSVNVIPNQPILIVSSSADRLVDYRCSLKLQQSWDKDYRQHDTAGHDLPLDAPHWLVAVVSQWISQC
ncbi:MAG: alpha/beta hydrolase, partial [Methyloprofundus sp.]|nr:alpha/beta hydrolase [Methyloprofundus sp.]